MKPFHHGINTIKNSSRDVWAMHSWSILNAAFICARILRIERTVRPDREDCSPRPNGLLSMSGRTVRQDRTDCLPRPNGLFSMTERTVRQDRTDCSPWPNGPFSMTRRTVRQVQRTRLLRSNNLFVMIFSSVKIMKVNRVKYAFLWWKWIYANTW